MEKPTELPEPTNIVQLVLQKLCEREREGFEGAYLPFKLLLSG